MRKSLLLLVVVGLLASLPVIAERVQLGVWNQEPIVLNGRDFIYVEHGIRQTQVDGEWPYESLGYSSFRAYALDRALFELFVNDHKVYLARFRTQRDNFPASWSAGWSFFFPPNTLPAGTFSFTGHWYAIQPDGTETEAWRTRQVTIEY